MRRLLKDVAAGRETKGDTSTLEDLSVLAKLRQRRVAGRPRFHRDPDGRRASAESGEPCPRVIRALPRAVPRTRRTPISQLPVKKSRVVPSRKVALAGATGDYRGGSRQPPQERDRRHPEDPGRGHGPTHARVDSGGARVAAASAARTWCSSAATAPTSCARATPSSRTCTTTTGQNNNILLSLLMAREYLGDGFVSTYARHRVRRRGRAKAGRLARRHRARLRHGLARRYVGRTQHPETDAEKLRADGTRVRRAQSRTIPSEQASGEFIGVMKLIAGRRARSPGAFDQRRARLRRRHVPRGPQLSKGVSASTYCRKCWSTAARCSAKTPRGGYMEIDTLQDLSMSEKWWKERP